MTVTLDTALGHGNAGSTNIVTFATTAPVAVGARIVVIAAFFQGGTATTLTVSGGGLSWAQDNSAVSGSLRIFQWSALAPAGLSSGTTITGTANAVGNDLEIEGVSLLGVDTASPVVAFNGGGASTAAWSSGSIAAGVGNAIVGGAFCDGLVGTSAPGGSNTEFDDFNVVGQNETMTGVFNLNTAASDSASGTFSSAVGHVVSAVAYRAATAAGGAIWRFPRGPHRRMRRLPRGPLGLEERRFVVAATGQVFTVTPAGSVTPTGNLVKQAQKPLGGTVTPAGALAKLASKLTGGATTPAGALVKVAQKALGGNVTPTGTFAKIKVALLALAGSITPSGALTKRADKALGGSTTPTGTIARSTLKALLGSITPSGALRKLVSKPLAGATTPTGTLSRAKVVLLALAGSISPSGALRRQAGKALGGASAPSGALKKAVSKTTAGSVTPTGSLAKAISRRFAGAITPVGTVARAIVGAVSQAINVLTFDVPMRALRAWDRASLLVRSWDWPASRLRSHDEPSEDLDSRDH